MPRIPVAHCSFIEGPLYYVHGEDEVFTVFDTLIHATTTDGRQFVHATHVIKGAGEGPDGMCPNRDWRAEAERFCARVEARGSIDLAYWEPYTPRAVSWAPDADELAKIDPPRDYIAERFC